MMTATSTFATSQEAPNRLINARTVNVSPAQKQEEATPRGEFCLTTEIRQMSRVEVVEAILLSMVAVAMSLAGSWLFILAMDNVAG